MSFNFDLSSIVLGLLATCLFAECIVLVVRVNSLKNRMEAEAESIRNKERSNYEKQKHQLEMMLKESELEIKAEYEEMLLLAKNAKQKQDEKLAEISVELENAKFAKERSNAEFEMYKKMREQSLALRDEYVEKLSKLSGLDDLQIRTDAKAEIEAKCRDDLALYKRELTEKSKREIDASARRILLDAMQRLSVQMPQSSSATIVKIPDEAMKGRLIGKEGRNIRSFEAETATTLVIDESPDTVMISSFNPMRRAIAKSALEMLVLDGRISPATIEQAVKTAKDNVHNSLMEIGEQTVQEVGLVSVSDSIKLAIGKLSLHLSLNQDTLAHSIEVAKLSALIASELDCDADIARRAGLFHDIGKSVSNSDLSHSKAGAELLRSSGESFVVVNAVESHHGEVPAESIYSTVVQIADSISATRVGARMEASEGYIRRVKTLENIAQEFEGVSSAYVLQAGRELRVIVSPEAVSDIQAQEIISKIRQKIEEKMANSIPVKITLIRERRWVEATK